MDQKEEKKIPNHIGIIMDGNRRWAEERNLPSFEGHLKGYEKLRKAADWVFAKGIKILSVYAFSTENWNRSQDEVNYLMKLIKIALEEEAENAREKGYKIMISGKVSELPGDLPEACYSIMEKTQGGINGTLNICLNYGGRAEIVDAIRKMIKNNLSAEQVHEGAIRKYLYNELPDPDVIARTSGEQRLSGFLLWQSAYSELVFLRKYWPEFEESDIDFIIDEYSSRKRRFGGG
ncbi:MAG: polyprenyl diphosphate synthase [Patescibacteria group bacterium]